MLKRREFIQKTAMAGSLLPFAPAMGKLGSDFSQENLEIHVFSKHLEFLDYDAAAQAAKEIGFDGVELTVRPGGHILPENVERDLPKAVEAVKKVGLKTDLIVTAITEVNSLSKSILETAAGLGIKAYRLGYYRYPNELPIPDGLAIGKDKFQKLAKFNESLGLLGHYQNHAGGLVGASIWEIWQLLEMTDDNSMGCQYDIRHAMVEGGHGWPIGLRLIRPRITCLVAKDYRWERDGGKWRLVNTPLGEGMVDFVSYFKKIKEYGIHVPITVHYEYDMGGAEHGDAELIGWTKEQVFEAMKRDLDKLKKFWREA